MSPLLMVMPPVIIVALQAAGAVLFGLGLRACGTHRRHARCGLWVAPVLWVLAGILTVPAAATLLIPVANVLVAIAFLTGFAFTLTTAARNHPTRRLDPTPGDES